MKTFDERWEEVHKGREWGKYPSEDVIRFIARNYYNTDRKEVSILDVGCGAGANTWYLAKEGFQVYALDGSKSAIENAEERLKKEELSAKFKVADAAKTGYGNEVFDVIVDSAVIYANTLEGIRTILKEMYKILKDDGKIFSTGLFNKETTGYGTGVEIEDGTYRNVEEGALEGLGTVHFFEQKEIEKLWKEIGFKEIKIDCLTRTDQGQEVTVSYYIVEAKK